MDTKALRQKILDLAIRGKLVPQDPNDEPASVLLERIRAEKQQMVTDGKLSTKDIKNDTIIFVGEDSLHYENIPKNWAVASFSQLNFFQSSSINPLMFPNEYFELYSVPNYELDFPEIVKGEDIGSTKQAVANNDVLLCKINPRINRVWTVKQVSEYRQIASSEWIVFRNPNLYAPYMRFYFSSPFFHEILLTNVSGVGGSLMRAQPESVKKYPIIIPPLPEQHRIASKLDEIMSVIDKIESEKTDLLSAIRLAKSKILDLAIRGKLVPQDPSDEPASVLLSRIRAEKQELIKQGKIKPEKGIACDDSSPFEKLPQNWAVASFSQLNLFQSSSINPLMFPNEFFELYSVPNYEIDVPEIVKGEDIGSTKLLVAKNDVLLCKINPRINRVWTVKQISEYRQIASSEWIVFRNPNLYAPYMRFYFSSPFFREILLTNVSGVGGSLMRAQPESVKKYPIIVPPLPEQHRIADTVKNYFDILDVIEKSLG